MVLRPGTAGEVLKKKSIVVLLFDKANPSAGVPFTVQSLAWTLTGSTGSLRLIPKSVGAIKTVKPHMGSTTVQALAVTAARASRNAMMTMINVVARFIFAFYRFVAAM
jgi:hypothetical protein